MKTNFITIFKQKSGVAIMSVMLFFMVIMIMVGALTISSQGNLRVAGDSAEYTGVYYVAEAGINFVLSDFMKVIGIEDGDLNQAEFEEALNDFITEHGSTRITYFEDSDSYADISFKNVTHNKSSKSFEFTVVSTGVLKGQTRTLETFVDLDYSLGAGRSQGFAVKHAILVSGSLTTGQHFTIDLSDTVKEANPTETVWVATTSEKKDDLKFNNVSKYSGKVELLVDAPSNVTNLTGSRVSKTLARDKFPPVKPFPPIDMVVISEQAAQIALSGNRLGPISGLTVGSNIQSSSGSYTIDGGDYYVPQVLFTGNVTIDASNDVFIVTDYLSFNGNLTLTGEGEVTFYVRKNSADNNNTFSLQGSRVGNFNDQHLFIVYVDAHDHLPALNVTATTGSIISGSFMFKKANINFSNHSSFAGYLMTGGDTLSLSNHADVVTTALYYAPNATVYTRNHSTVQGAIIAKNVEMGNHSKILYEPAFDTNFPFVVESPIVGNVPLDGVRSIAFIIHRTTER